MNIDTEFAKQLFLLLPPLRFLHRGIANPTCALRFSDDAKNIVMLRPVPLPRAGPAASGNSLAVFSLPGVNPGAVGAHLR